MASCAPVVDSLLAETKIVGDVFYGLTGFEQVEHLPATSSRILTHHEFLSVESPPQFHQTDSEKPRAHQTRCQPSAFAHPTILTPHSLRLSITVQGGRSVWR